jgi:diguanylate cyclase (GGDEF)-like protein
LKKLKIKWPKPEGRLDREMERGFRLNSLRDDKRLAGVGIMLLAVVVALTIPNDFVFGLQPNLLGFLIVLRFVFIIYSIALVIYLGRKISPERYDNNIFIWGLFGVAANTLIIFTRPVSYTGHALIDLVILVIIYLGIPFRLSYRVILALLFTAGCLTLVAVNAQQLSAPWIRVEVSSLIFLNIVALIISHHLYSNRRKQYITQVAEARIKEELRLAASRDSMTGILNHKAFFEQGEREMKRFERYGKAFSLIEIDIDDFKGINDTFGHSEGDNVLLKLVSLVSTHVRQSDIFGRTGGDEFCVLLIETNKSDATDIAERIRSTCSGCRLIADTGAPIHFTVSVGLVESCKDDTGIGQMYSRADAAMYRAKREGHDRVCPA